MFQQNLIGENSIKFMSYFILIWNDLVFISQMTDTSLGINWLCQYWIWRYGIVFIVYGIIKKRKGQFDQHHSVTILEHYYVPTFFSIILDHYRPNNGRLEFGSIWSVSFRYIIRILRTISKYYVSILPPPPLGIISYHSCPLL